MDRHPEVGQRARPPHAAGDAITIPVNSLSHMPCVLCTLEQHAAAIADDTHRNIRVRTPASIWGSTPSPAERASLKAQGLNPFQPSPGKIGSALTRELEAEAGEDAEDAQRPTPRADICRRHRAGISLGAEKSC